eukprot:UN06062
MSIMKSNNKSPNSSTIPLFRSLPPEYISISISLTSDFKYFNISNSVLIFGPWAFFYNFIDY